MKRLFLTLGCAVVLTGCGGGSSGGGSAQDEANVVLKPPMLLTSALEMARRHEVQPTELGMEFVMLGETISSHVTVKAGESDRDIIRNVRDSASGMTDGMEGSMLSDTQLANLREVQRRMRSGPWRIVQMVATGSADDLRELSEEPGVQAVGLKSEILERVRRAREGQ